MFPLIVVPVFPGITKCSMKLGNITRNEMYKVFNCGIGFCLILDRDDVEKAKKINSKLFEIGYVSKTEKKFIFKN